MAEEKPSAFPCGRFYVLMDTGHQRYFGWICIIFVVGLKSLFFDNGDEGLTLPMVYAFDD